MRKFKNLSLFTQETLRELSEMSIPNLEDIRHLLNADYEIEEIDSTLSMYTLKSDHARQLLQIDDIIQHGKGRICINDITEEFHKNVLISKASEYRTGGTINNEHFDSELEVKVVIDVNNEMKLHLDITNTHYKNLPYQMLYGIRFLTWIWINLQQASISPIQLTDTHVSLKGLYYEDKENTEIKLMISDLL